MRILLVGAGASYSTKDVEDGYIRALRAAGHQIVPWLLDARIDFAGRFLHGEWRQARRDGVEIPRPTPLDVLYKAQQGILERALRLQVDGVLFISGMYVVRDTLVLLRRASVPTGIVFTESPYDDAPQAGHASIADVCWTNERSSVELIRQRSGNPNTYYLPPAYDPAVHKPAAGDDGDAAAVAAHDVVFVGTAFPERVELLSKIDWTGIDLGLYGYWPSLGSRSHLRKFLKGGITDNSHAVELYRSAKIGLNLYRTSMGFQRGSPRIQHAESFNPRALELAASGCFQISDDRAEVRELFGSSVPTFRTPAELEGLVRTYVASGSAQTRQSMTDRSRWCVQGQTFAARVAQLVPQLEAAWRSPRLLAA